MKQQLNVLWQIEYFVKCIRVSSVWKPGFLLRLKFAHVKSRAELKLEKCKKLVASFRSRATFLNPFLPLPKILRNQFDVILRNIFDRILNNFATNIQISRNDIDQKSWIYIICAFGRNVKFIRQKNLCFFSATQFPPCACSNSRPCLSKASPKITWISFGALDKLSRTAAA